MLEHHANFTTHFIDLLEVVGQFDVVDDDLALLVFFQAVDAANHGRFARARRPRHNDALAAHDLQVDVPQNVKLTIPLMHIANFNGDIGFGNLHLRAVNVLVKFSLQYRVYSVHEIYSYWSL